MARPFRRLLIVVPMFVPREMCWESPVACAEVRRSRSKARSENFEVIVRNALDLSSRHWHVHLLVLHTAASSDALFGGHVGVLGIPGLGSAALTGDLRVQIGALTLHLTGWSAKRGWSLVRQAFLEMLARVDRFDYFLYHEDDLDVPARVVSRLADDLRRFADSRLRLAPRALRYETPTWRRVVDGQVSHDPDALLDHAMLCNLHPDAKHRVCPLYHVTRVAELPPGSGRNYAFLHTEDGADGVPWTVGVWMLSRDLLSAARPHILGLGRAGAGREAGNVTRAITTGVFASEWLGLRSVLPLDISEGTLDFEGVMVRHRSSKYSAHIRRDGGRLTWPGLYRSELLRLINMPHCRPASLFLVGGSAKTPVDNASVELARSFYEQTCVTCGAFSAEQALGMATGFVPWESVEEYTLHYYVLA